MDTFEPQPGQYEQESVGTFQKILMQLKSGDEWKMLLSEMQKPSDERDDEAIQSAKIAFGRATQVSVEQVPKEQHAAAQIARNFTLAEIALEEAKLAFYDVRDEAYQEGPEFDGVVAYIKQTMARLAPPKPEMTA